MKPIIRHQHGPFFLLFTFLLLYCNETYDLLSNCFFFHFSVLSCNESYDLISNYFFCCHFSVLSCNETYDLLSHPIFGVPDSSLRASSNWFSYDAKSSRLNSRTCWVGVERSPPHWIQVFPYLKKRKKKVFWQRILRPRSRKPKKHTR